MNRLTMVGISTFAAAAMAAGGLAVTASAGAATSHGAAAARPAATAHCSTARHNFGYPKATTTYKAGAAGAVSIAPVNSGTIKVAAVHFARHWRGYVDSGRGSSVDVYFRSGTHRVKFEAEINDAGGLTVTVTSCR